MVGLLFAALLPVAVLMWYVYGKDKVEKEPTGLITKVFILGAISGPVAAIIETILFSVFEAAIPEGMLLLVVEYFIGVALVEELCKYFCLNTIHNNPNFNYVFDAVVYSVAAALGFAALENVLYVFDGGIRVAVTRAIFSVPGHAADGAMMGLFYGLSRKYEVRGDVARAKKNRMLCILIPVIEHGVYDCALSTGNDFMVLFALLIELVFIGFGIAIVRTLSKRDEPLDWVNTPQAPMGPQMPMGMQ